MKSSGKRRAEVRSEIAARHRIKHGETESTRFAPKRRPDRTEILTRQISACAQRKEIEKAESLFKQLRLEGLLPSIYTFSALMNGYVNCGDVAGAEKVVRKMRKAGIPLELVDFNTLIKGYCTVGDMAAAKNVIMDMISLHPPLLPDVKTCSTFLRGCLRVGDIDLAFRLFRRMQKDWNLEPDDVCHRVMARLLSQGLRLRPLKKFLEMWRSVEIDCTLAPVVLSSAGGTRACTYWAKGMCSKGKECTFYHDPGIGTANAVRSALARLTTVASLHVNTAHAAALLGDRKLCKHALKCARKLLDQASTAQSPSLDGRWNQQIFESQEHVRAELMLDTARICCYLEKCLSPMHNTPPDLVTFLKRTLVFSSHQTCQEENSLSSTKETPENLTNALIRSFGLNECCNYQPQSDKVGCGLSNEQPSMYDTVCQHFAKCVGKDGRLRWNRLFGNKLPVRLELCSGNGDWVVAQAKAEEGKANWAAVELRCDRLYSAFSRLVLECVPNLCILGGDAAQVLSQRIPTQSCSMVLVNFPEPPLGSKTGEESKLHLLTSKFFLQIYKVLSPKGKLTIFSDNYRYCLQLARTLHTLNKHFKVVKKDVESSFEEVQGIRVYHGVPTVSCGHVSNVTSYFDRKWEHAGRLDRFFIVLSRRRDEND